MTEIVSGRKLSIGLGAALICVLAFLVIGERADRRKPDRQYASFLEDVEVLNIQNGNTAWRALSKKVRLSDDGKDAWLDGVVIEVPSQSLAMRAQSGTFDIEGNTLDLKGSITTEIKGFTVVTESARVVQGGKVSAGDRVLLTGEGVRIEGRGLEAAEQQTVRLKKDVRAVFE